MSLSQKRKAEALKNLGLDELPNPRHEIAEDETPTSGFELVNFHKAMMCVDPIETAAFSHYIPDGIVIDQKLDTRSFKQGRSQAIKIPARGPLPGVNELVTHATGITGKGDRHDRFLYLATYLRGYYDFLGATACSPPLISTTRDMLILNFKLDFKMKADLTSETQSGLGVLKDSLVEQLDHGKISREEFNDQLTVPDAIISVKGE